VFYLCAFAAGMSTRDPRLGGGTARQWYMADNEGRSLITPKRLGGLVLVALLLVFWAQNREKTKVTFYFADAEVRVWVALVCASAVGFVLGFLVRGDRG
jgi:uncharacterized membrane-anchored protein